ncbi:conserved hypothetical protein [Verticillium alfalfae VaMs.102]|uniref:Nucleoporin NUP49/NSP49 n=1 Tax=Verticillium alfalfae (strain VaMs.102 / ATCC MYA-4576 / FGSC 10136) TaxID=526221 RepID=C9SU75_VERA1|nr:conserved hypothetical protein [Verticillium alfalfae VaMs.102]EEY22386.1 conserved hypothetical protein [Verticillium alfalfae VaMs.102]
MFAANKPAGLTLNTPSSGGGLFGNTQSSTTAQQPASGGLFGGGANTQSQQQPASGGLFGNTASNQQTQQQGSTGGGGLFGGSTLGQPQQQQQQQSTGGGLFGASTTQNNQQQAGGGLFGASTALNTQQQQQQQPQQQSGGLFSSTTQQKPAGLFGGSTAAPAQQSTGAGLTMGQSTNQGAISGVRIDSQRQGHDQIETCDNIIQQYMSQAGQIKSFMTAHEGDLARLTHDVEWLTRKFDGVKTTLEDDVKMTAQLKEVVKSDADIAKAAFAGAEQLKLPAHYHTTWLTANKPAAKSKDKEEEPALEDCITLFSNEADRLNQMHQFQVQKVKEMEQHMPGVENGLYERMRALRDGAPHFAGFGFAVELLDTVKALGDEIVRAAGLIVESREKLTELQLRTVPSRK